ncbi:hypothetical protein [Flavobacterium sp.]|uniref:hypothetical protein n=1 Tax=Flavobacterium sp. TaxID=239 RepID=UPI0026039BBF|nr:hypothetical protein [Flavobacterium sp.]
MQKDLHQEVAHYLSKNYTYTNTIRFLVRDGFTEDEVRTAIKAYLKENRPMGMDVLAFAFLVIHTAMIVPLYAYFILPQESFAIKLTLLPLMIVIGILARYAKDEQPWAIQLMSAVTIPAVVYLVYLAITYANYLSKTGHPVAQYLIYFGLLIYTLFVLSTFRGVKQFFERRK